MLKAKHWIGVVEQGKEAETGIGIGCGASKEPTEQGHGCCCCCTSRKKMSLPCKPSQGIYLPCCCGEDRREPPYHVRILFLPMVLNPSCVQVSGFRLHACTHHVKQPWRWRREPPCLCCLSSSASYCQVLLLTVSSAGSLYALSLFHARRNATPPFPLPCLFSLQYFPFAPCGKGKTLSLVMSSALEIATILFCRIHHFLLISETASTCCYILHVITFCSNRYL